MFWIIVIAIALFAGLGLIGFALHILFSPLLLVVAIGILAWLMLRPRRSRR